MLVEDPALPPNVSPRDVRIRKLEEENERLKEEHRKIRETAEHYLKENHELRDIKFHTFNNGFRTGCLAPTVLVLSAVAIYFLHGLNSQGEL